VCFVYGVHHCSLHSFPTRRSSDLNEVLNETDARNYAYAIGVSGWEGLVGRRPGEVVKVTLGDLLNMAVQTVPVTSSTPTRVSTRSEEHTSELQSRFDLVCRLLLEK